MNSNASNRGLVNALIGIGIFLAIAALFAVSYISAHNTANALEKSIVATYDNNKVILAQYGLKVAEAAQVPEIAREDTRVLIREAIQGRYGADGSKAVFQAISEQNPSIDPVLYRNLQTVIEAGRNAFETGQKRLRDQKRVYETALGTFWTGKFMSAAGFPKIDLNAYQATSTEQADSAFKSGKETPMQLRPAR